jgi:hypothetical protein
MSGSHLRHDPMSRLEPAPEHQHTDDEQGPSDPFEVRAWMRRLTVRAGPSPHRYLFTAGVTFAKIGVGLFGAHNYLRIDNKNAHATFGLRFGK